MPNRASGMFSLINGVLAWLNKYSMTLFHTSYAFNIVSLSRPY